MRPKLFSVRRSVAPFAGALALMTNAHATYTVIDDDLYPTAVIQARSRSVTDWSADTFKVNFRKGSSIVGPLARPSVDDWIPRMQAAALVRIVGRADSATATENKKQHSLGLARASALRTYLIRAGIPSDIIQVELDATGNPLASNGISQADIVISNKPDPRASAYQASAQIRAPQEPAIPHTYRYLNQETEAPAARLITAAPAAVAPQAQASRNSSDERLIQYINQAVQAGQMLPSVAAQILRSLAEANTTPQQPVPAAAPAPQPAAAPTYSAAVPAKSVPPRVERWVLDARLTLKENVDEWSKASGWRPTNWEAGNFYQVTSTTVLDGAFPDVLKRIADSTGLNICAITRDKYVRVTDSNVPCSK